MAATATPVKDPAGPPAGAKPKSPTDLHWVRWGQGFRYAGKDYDPGQVLTLGGYRNDEKLVRLRYVDPVKKGQTLYTCGPCGAQFIEAGYVDAHGDKRHRPTPEEIEASLLERAHAPVPGDTEMRVAGRKVPDLVGGLDTTGDRREKRVMDETPLDLSKTKAAQQA